MAESKKTFFIDDIFKTLPNGYDKAEAFALLKEWQKNAGPTLALKADSFKADGTLTTQARQKLETAIKAGGAITIDLPAPSEANRESLEKLVSELTSASTFDGIPNKPCIILMTDYKKDFRELKPKNG